MSVTIKKHPKDMTRQELFDMLQQVQKHAKSQGQHSPMYTTTMLAPGQAPTVNDMHEGAARQHLTALYQSQSKPASTSSQEQQVAQNAYTDTLGEWRDIAKEGAGLLHERDKEILKTYNNAGQRPKDFKDAIDKGLYGTIGDKQTLKDEYDKMYKSKWGKE